MSKLNLIPVSNHIVVKRDEANAVSAGGIIIPEVSKQKKPSRGKVLAVGPGKKKSQAPSMSREALENRGVVYHVPMDVKEGDTVLFAQYSGQEVELDGEKYTIITEDDVVALLGA